MFGSSVVVVVVRVYVFWSSLKSVTCRLSFWVVLVYHKKLSEAFGLVFRVKETSKSEQEKNRREEPLKVFVRLIHTPAVLKLCLLFSNKYCYVQLNFFGKFCTVLFGKLWFFKKEKKIVKICSIKFDKEKVKIYKREKRLNWLNKEKTQKTKKHLQAKFLKKAPLTKKTRSKKGIPQLSKSILEQKRKENRRPSL